MLLQKKQITGLIDSLTLLQANIDGKPNMAAVNTAIDTAIAALVDGAPTALDTLKELAEKLQGEETALNALITTVDGKVAKTDVTNHIDATNGGFLADGSVASYSNILWLRSLHSNLAGIIDDLTAQVAGHATRLDAVEQMTSDLDDAKVSKYSITDLPGVASDEEERVAGFASVQELQNRIANALNDIDDVVNDIADTNLSITNLSTRVDGKVSGIKSIPIHQDINWAGYAAGSSADITLPSDSNQALEVKLNGQVFPVGTGEAFSIFSGGAASTLGDGKYVTGNFLHIDGSKLGFTMETTDKIYVTLVSTL